MLQSHPPPAPSCVRRHPAGALRSRANSRRTLCGRIGSASRRRPQVVASQELHDRRLRGRVFRANLSQHRAHRRRRLGTHVGRALLVARCVSHLGGRRLDTRAEVLCRCGPCGRLLRRAGLPLACAQKAARHLVQRRVDLALLAGQASEALLRLGLAVGPGDVVQDPSVIHDQLARRLLPRAGRMRRGGMRADHLVDNTAQPELVLEHIPPPRTHARLGEHGSPCDEVQDVQDQRDQRHTAQAHQHRNKARSVHGKR
mmetsp:Transcript_34771/g.91500  ORF Transcript_34771/g.91500 Transcript_34771/m.91500 type:complete len:257 (+) Transcript_34771:405-1175(+)